MHGWKSLRWGAGVIKFDRGLGGVGLDRGYIYLKCSQQHQVQQVTSYQNNFLSEVRQGLVIKCIKLARNIIVRISE